MKRIILVSLVLFGLFSFNLTAQEQTQLNQKHIRSGFYLRMGPVFALGKYAEGQTIITKVDGENETSVFLPAKIGGAMDLGYLIYIGPSFANHFLRAGIDATFLTVSFNTTDPNVTENKYKYWYYYVGEKFGPVITINPVDRLMIDLSYKLNAYVVYSNTNGWGRNLFQNEVSMNIRYSIMMFSFQYNFGKANFNAFDKANPDRFVENNTLRVLIGLKF